LLDHKLLKLLRLSTRNDIEEKLVNSKLNLSSSFISIWFDKAIKRGAKPEEVDYEIKRVVRDTKDENKRREVVEYPLKRSNAIRELSLI